MRQKLIDILKSNYEKTANKSGMTVIQVAALAEEEVRDVMQELHLMRQEGIIYVRKGINLNLIFLKV